ncbi:MAG: hypothetical protein JJE12_03200 [Anaerolineales bacterium]|nr:hypothetical protein [Anaerolineales bacterium]
MKVSDYTSFARVIDPRYPTNLAILVIATICGGCLFIFNFIAGYDIFGAVAAAFSFAVSVFITWAIGREIDPEHELAAFAGLVLVIPGFLFLGTPDLVMALTMLLLLRMLNRSTGLHPKPLDSLSIIALGSLLIMRGVWIFGFLCAAGLLIDSMLSELMRRNLMFSGVMTAITILSLFIIKPALPQITIIPGELILVIGSTILFIPLVKHSKNVDVICDYQPEKLNPVRLQTSQVFAISTAGIVWLAEGSMGIMNLFPLWSGIIGVSLLFLISTLINTVRRNPGNT